MKSPEPVQPIAERFPALEEQEVVLTFYAPEARVVQVAGTFNGWRPVAGPLARSNPEEWNIRMMLRSGRYEYRFVVDGAWADDPQAGETVANPYGGLNSVLEVKLDEGTELP